MEKTKVTIGSIIDDMVNFNSNAINSFTEQNKYLSKTAAEIK